MSTSTTINSSSYDTILLHLSKHPTATVFGFLLGRPSASGNGVDVEKAVPLSHHWTSLAPMAEVGLALTTTFAESQGFEIVGIYEAPRDVAERTPSGHALRLAEKVASMTKGGEATLLLVNNSTLLVPTNHSLLHFTVSAPPATGRSASAAAATTLPAATPKYRNHASTSISFSRGESIAQIVNGAREKVAKRAWTHLVDFDDHLENPTLSWLTQPATVVA
ncbi:uncharacterized protein PFL1_02489 [Pseudozyma flocculosa PF-1]|uniref:MPN domain-containing protein n=2 Tax=Pseudozyma flocculosa TaxID=84751 RepID=A0A5C3EY10_9BASI|nr:uncharacterized protein PFL1_02489 [Pseudozyma flocculosa PF-1]EPQ29816.1 hypothetical protein PFL1_02489 [Pseudozyma flocculosa PF-1]SPO37108.1 uncharacterized protein PSFLO_02580 [Pseudozyma flocculosa]